MASAQVLPSSRKQEHLAAGKRRLEEFRKKKAADRTKKSSSSNGNNVTSSERQPSDSQLIIPANSDGASRQSSTSEIMDRAFDNSQRSEQNQEFLINDTTNMFSGSSSHMHAGDKDCNYTYEVLSSNGLVDHSIDHETAERKGDSAISEGTSCGLTSVHDFKGNEETLGKLNNSNSRDLSLKNPEMSLTSVASDVNSQNFPSFSRQTKFEAFQPSSVKGLGPDNGQVMPDVAISDVSQKSNIDERKLASSSSGWPKVQNLAPYTQPQYSSTSYSSNYSKSSDHTTLYPQKSEAQPRRSRPSFLDSLNVPKGSSLVLPDNYVESRESISGNEAKICTDSRGKLTIGTPYTDNLAASVTAVSNGKHFPDAGEHSVEKKPEFYQLKQDEDFAALEQHIEDLTQEKFSLQRALEASRALAESLASENSSLTDSYNQQRSAVNQLKADMENLQEQLSKQLVELESLKHEYMNAQLECNAADERAKLLASEVIGLEEKALRLRSSELKLERQLENSQAEIASFKKKVSGLAKERLDLQSTISSLQEEKKLLQSKLRKSSGGNSIEARENSDNKKDMSTSTDDLETGASIYTSSQQMEHSLSITENGASASISLPDIFHSNPEASFAYIPPDQLHMIESISAIISELTLEKEELVKSLASVISDNSKIKDLNKELSLKLEAQTQRLELLTAQSMANDGILAKHPNPSTVLDNATYADEGDEVVERVLGWIMKLFPGGPSRRRTSKRL